MNEKVTLQDVVDLFVLRTKLPKRQAELFVRSFLLRIEDALSVDKFVKIKGLGTFKLILVEKRESVNVNTGERFEIKSHTRISFVADTSLKEAVNHPFEHFQTVILSDDVTEEVLETVDKEWKEEMLQQPNESLNDEASLAELLEEETDLEVFKEDIIEQTDEIISSSNDLHSNANDTPSKDNEKKTTADDVIKQNNVLEVLIEPEVKEPFEPTIPQPHLKTCLQEEADMNPKDDISSIEESENITPNPSSKIQNKPEKDENEIDNNTQNVEKPTEGASTNPVASEAVDEELIKENIRAAHRKIIEAYENEDEETPRRKRRRPSNRFLKYTLFSIALVVLYIVGYSHMLCPCNFSDGYQHFKDYTYSRFVGHNIVQGDTAEIVSLMSHNVSDIVITVPKTDSMLVDTLSHQPEQPTPQTKEEPTIQTPKEKNTSPASPKQTSANAAQQYKQLPRGKYLITGTKGTHKIAPGQTLQNIAYITYGSKDYVPYIILYNDIKSPDLVPVGKVIKLPELEPK